MPRSVATDSLRAPVGNGTSTISVPHLFSPRSYQARPMAYVDGGGKRAVTVWHRRAGKDLTWINQIIKQMITAPTCGTYLHVFPKLTQGRRDLWDAKSSPASGGIPFRSHFPPELVLEASETEMQITLRPMPHQNPQPITDSRGRKKFVGSIFQVMGTDKESIENLRGINATGVVFSEFATQNPEAWTTIIEPVLLENGGWAAFDFTPKGENHAYALYQTALKDPSWFCELLTIEDTLRDAPGESGEPVITLDQIETLRAHNTAEEVIQQEYFCSFKGYLHGTIYGDLLRQARLAGRVCRVPWVSALPVGIMWDIGRTEATAIWFYQCVGSEIRFIDYYSNVRQGADHYAKVLREKPYLYGKMILPHDARNQGFSAVESTETFLARTICRNVRVLTKKTPVQTGIEATRRMFSRFVFDEVACEAKPNKGAVSGLAALGNYHREWNEEFQDYSGDPIHDNYSHGADALRYGMLGWEEGLSFIDAPENELVVETSFDLRSYRQTPALRGGTNVRNL